MEGRTRAVGHAVAAVYRLAFPCHGRQAICDIDNERRWARRDDKERVKHPSREWLPDGTHSKPSLTTSKYGDSRA